MSHVLLVDDDPDILHILAAALECAGHQVHATPDPVEVGPLTHRHQFDAVVLDVMMPRRSGWEVLEELRRDPHTLHLPVLMLSAIGDSANRVRGLRMGANDFLGKPFHPEEVIVRVEGLLSRRTETHGLQGDFSTVTAADILQSLEHGATSGVLEVRTPGGEGRFRLVAGRCVGAAFAGLTGAEALTALLGEKEGEFRLRGRCAPEPADDVALPPLSSMLLEEAWIQDELRLRRHLLPPAGGALYALEGQPPPAPPTGLPELPLAAVVHLLRTRPGLSLDELLAAHLAAPERLRLAVACLVEWGGVAQETGSAVAGPEPGEDGLAPLLGELAEECRLRGFTMDPVEIAVLVHPGSWAGVAPLLAGLPARGGTPSHLAGGAGRLTVSHPAGSLSLQIRTLIDGPEPAGPDLGRHAGVVLWLGERPGEAVRAAAAVERQADPRAFLLAVSPGGRGPLPERRLRVVRRAPRDLTALLADLLSPLTDDGDDGEDGGE